MKRSYEEMEGVKAGKSSNTRKRKIARCPDGMKMHAHPVQSIRLD